MKRSSATRLALFVVVAALLASCGSDDSGPGDAADPADTTAAGSAPTAASGATTQGGDGLEGSLSVSAAASLRDAFDVIGAGFTAEHPDVEVVFNFDSSSTLAAQVLEGAPADVLASAEPASMTRLVDADELDGEPEIFARNRLVIVTEPGNPGGIEGLADLAGAGIVSLCGEDVPCGRYAQEALDRAGVTLSESTVTRGQNVAATLTAVTDGDAVAAVVYATDAVSAGDTVERIDIPGEHDVLASYPIAALADGGDTDLARAFVEYVLGPASQSVLEEHGFLAAA